jgi:flagellar biosynthetic protein FliR
MLALMLSVLLSPVLHGMPAIPGTVGGLFVLVFAEILIGLFLGGLSRMLIAAVHIAAAIIAYQASMSSALTNGITGFQGQDTSLGNLLSVTVVVLIFATDLHHLMLQGLADSYTLFRPGEFPMVEDFASHATGMMTGIFQMAVKMAAPNIVIGMIFQLGMGIIARLMPNIQIFAIMIAPQLIINLSVLMITVSAILLAYMTYFRDTLGTFLIP